MAGVLQHLRSSTLNKRPNPASMVDGQMAINYASGSPGAFFKDTSGNLVKVGPVHVGATAPNVSPASGGTAGNSLGEQWLDTSGGTYVFKIWDGGAWRSEAGEFVNTTGDTMTGALGIIAGSASTPGLFFSGDANSGLYSPGEDQAAISTGGSGRLFVDASGRVIVGAATAAIGTTFEIVGNTNGQAIGVRGRSSDNIGIISFHPNASATEYARIQSNGDSSLSFGTGSSGSERLRITSAGLVGVGSSSPGYPLTIQSTSRPQVHVSYNGNGGLFVRDATDTARINWQVSTSEYNADAFQITPSTTAGGTTFTTPAITVDSLSRVGIGTTSAGHALQVNGAICATGAFGTASANTCTLDASSGRGRVIVSGPDASTYSSLAFGRLYSDGSGYTETARFDASGRLLVGTSTARGNFYGGYTSRAQIEGVDFETAALNITCNNATDVNSGVISLNKSGGATVGSNTIVSNGERLGSLRFQGNDGTNFIDGAYVLAEVDGTPGTNDMPTRLVFSTTADGASSPTERMRIDNNGGTSTYTTGTFGLALGTSSGAGTTNSILVGVYNRTGTTTGGSEGIKIYSNGNIQNINNSYGALSDIKLKENIVDANSQWDDLKALRVRNYNLKEGQTHAQIGLVAQEVEPISPGLVYESPDRDAEGNDLGTVTKSVNYSVLYMKAVKALQEAMERIEQLETEMAAVKAQLS